MMWFKRLLCRLFNHKWVVISDYEETHHGKIRILTLVPPIKFKCTRCGKEGVQDE